MSSSSPEKKLIKVLRTILSFILAVVISTLSVSLCFGTSFIKPSRVEKSFTSYEYVSGARQNFLTYVEGYYQKSGFEADNLEKIIRYDAVKEVANYYAGCYVSPVLLRKLSRKVCCAERSHSSRYRGHRRRTDTREPR